MIKAKILYNNVIKGLTPTWSGTTATGKPPASSIDWLDWTFFEADAGNLDFTVGADTDIDSVALYCATAAGSNSIELQYESAPSTFTSLATFSTPSGTLDITEFTGVTVSSGRRIRFVITAATTIDIRQLIVGEVMEAEQGAWATVTAPDFVQGVKVTNNISQNGSMLGRSIKRSEKTGKIVWDHLTDSWCRNTLDSFVRHAARYPFIWQWDPTGHPNDVGFASATQINPAKHSANGYLSFEMPIKFLVADNEAL
jgi:hypothetical protein